MDAFHMHLCIIEGGSIRHAAWTMISQGNMTALHLINSLH